MAVSTCKSNSSSHVFCCCENIIINFVIVLKVFWNKWLLICTDTHKLYIVLCVVQGHLKINMSYVVELCVLSALRTWQRKCIMLLEMPTMTLESRKIWPSENLFTYHNICPFQKYQIFLSHFSVSHHFIFIISDAINNCR